MRRCYNPNQGSYKNYGAKGIQVAPEWHDFARFLEDMGAKPED